MLHVKLMFKEVKVTKTNKVREVLFFTSRGAGENGGDRVKIID